MLIEALFEIAQEFFTTAAVTTDERNPKGCYFALIGVFILIIAAVILYNTL